eukprot:jgi/Tetstr1/457664/TSEL_004245.t1
MYAASGPVRTQLAQLCRYYAQLAGLVKPPLHRVLGSLPRYVRTWLATSSGRYYTLCSGRFRGKSWFIGTIGPPRTLCPVAFAARARSWSAPSGRHCTWPVAFAARALWTIYRFTTNMTNATANTVSNRPDPEFAEWQFEVGGELMPPLPVRSTVETFSECLKAQHGLGVVDDLVNITKTQYELTTAAATDAASALAQDLEYLTSGAGKAKSGVDVRGVDVFFEQRWASATSHAFRLDTFAMFDGTLSIKNGRCSVTK